MARMWKFSFLSLFLSFFHSSFFFLIAAQGVSRRAQENEEDGDGVGEVAQGVIGDALRTEEGERGGGDDYCHAGDEEQAAARLVHHHVEALLLVLGSPAQEAEACAPAATVFQSFQ